MTTNSVLNYFDQPANSTNDNIYYGLGTQFYGSTAFTSAQVEAALSAGNGMISSNVVISTDDKLGHTLIRGRLKLDERPAGGTTEDYAFQIRSESAKTTGTHWGIDCETHVKANGSASVRSVQGVAVVDSTFTATSATYNGLYGQVRADGTFAGSGFLAAIYGLVEASAAITASHVCSLWLDSHQVNAVTGSHQLLYATNNGTAVMDEFIYLYGGNNITAFVSFDTCGGMVSATATTAGTSKKILINIDGSPYYINAYTG